MKTYTVKKGAHSSGSRFFPLILTRHMQVRVRFHKDCLYPGVPGGDINKLFGFSQGLNHMKNSKRIGWTSDNEVIILHYFDHVDGKMEYREFMRVPVETPITLELRDLKPSFLGYRLYFYFGGDDPAPHDMSVDMDWL